MKELNLQVWEINNNYGKETPKFLTYSCHLASWRQYQKLIVFVLMELGGSDGVVGNRYFFFCKTKQKNFRTLSLF